MATKLQKSFEKETLLGKFTHLLKKELPFHTHTINEKHHLEHRPFQ